VTPRRIGALIALAALAGCEAGTVAPRPETALALQVVIEGGFASVADAGTIHVEGPQTRTVSITPGGTATIDNLLPGSYTVALEAFASGQLEMFGERNVTVTAGRTSEVTISLTSFIPTDLVVPAEVVAGEEVTVTFRAVTGATSYVVQWATNPQFTNAESQEVTGTSATFTLATEGTHHVRVRARSRFGSNGVPATASPVVATPPATKLQEGVPLPDRAGTTGSIVYYSFDVPAGPAERVLQLRLRGGSGDADLAIKHGSRPTAEDFDCASVASPDDYSNRLDFCSVLNPQAGTWHVGIFGAAAYASVTLDARLLPFTTLSGGTPVGDLSGALSDVLYFGFDVPAAAAPPALARRSSAVLSGSRLLGTSKPDRVLPLRSAAGAAPVISSAPLPVPGTLDVAIQGGTGDADLFLSPRESPFSLSTIGAWTCLPLSTGNVDECSVADPDGGPWTAILLAFEAFSGVTIRADFQGPSGVLAIQKSIRSLAGAPLPGADLSGFVFEVQTQAGDPVTSVTTDAAGLAEVTLPPGPYVVLETDNQRLTDAVGGASVEVQSGERSELPWANHQGLGYVANLQGNSVSVVNRRNNAVVETVPVAGGPLLAEMTPDQSLVLVGNYNASSVTFIRTSDNTVLGTVAVGPNPVGIAIAPGGTLAYVANSTGGTISVIDIASRAVTSTITVGGNPNDISIIPSGTHAYVAFLGGTVGVLDLSTNMITESIAAGNQPFLMDMPADGSFVYVNNFGSGSISVIDVSSNEVVATIGVGATPRGIAVTPDGTLAFVTNRDLNRVTIVDLVNRQVVRNVAVGSNPSGIAVTPDGNWVYVSNQESNTVSVIDVFTGDVAGSFLVGQQPWGIVLSGGS
jgi:YVTN family beta-propeller protein